MSNMNISGKECTIKYVDNAASGDGSTPANALSNIPFGSITADTIYLIRRGSICTISASASSSLSNIFFIGMPLSTDGIYSNVPQEAIDAWGLDSPATTHAIVRFNSRDYTFTLTQCDNFGAFRIKFDRIVTESDDTSTTVNLILASTTSTTANLGGVCFFNECIFMEKDVDFSDNGYVWSQMYSFLALSIARFGYVTISNNKMIISQGNSRMNTPVFYITSAPNINIEKNEIWLASSGCEYYSVDYSSSIFSTQFMSTNNESNSTKKLYVRNNIVKYYGQDNIKQYFRKFLVTAALNYIIENNSFVFDRNAGTAPTTGGFLSILTLYNAVESFGVNNSYESNMYKVVKNINIDLRSSGLSYYNANLAENTNGNRKSFIFIDTKILSIDSAVPNVETLVDNINIIADSIVNTSLTTYATGQVTGNIFYFSGNNIESVKKININCPLMISDQACFILHAKYIQIDYSRGKCNFTRCGYVEIDTLNSSDLDYSNKIENINSIVKVRSFQKIPSATVDMYLDPTDSGNPKTIIENCNSDVSYSFVNVSTNMLQGSGIWVNNMYGLLGSWKASNHYYRAETWGVNRGHGATLKFTGTISDFRVPLSIGPTIFKGIQLIPNASSGTIKMYAAYKNYQNMSLFPTRVKYFVDSNVTGIVSGKTKKTTSSLVEGNIYDDVVSTWSESDLTAKVIEIPFYTDYPTDPLDIRILFDWYDPNGYTYIDITIDQG